MTSTDARVLILLYAGDYRNIYYRTKAGEVTEHHSHLFVMEALPRLCDKVKEIAILCCKCQDAYDEEIYPGFRTIGTGFKTEEKLGDLVPLIADYNPTHLVIRAPIKPVFQWAIRQQVPTITLLADSFFPTNWRDQFRNWQLKNCLNHPIVQWVGNHGVHASRSLVAIGVDSQKVIPWDWPHLEQPSQLQPKTWQANRAPLSLIFIGTLIESKGVGDVLRAVSLLKEQNISIRFQVVGKGDRERFESLSAELGLQDCVEFVGLIPSNQVVTYMNKADIVVVPSRHEYPEGLPRTIYQGLCSRSPLVVSDHPAFSGNLKQGETAMIFRAGHVDEIASCISRLYSDPELYDQLSNSAQSAWESLQISLKWGDFIEHWLTDPQDVQWFQEKSLAHLYSGHTH